jgi:uncharacterized protein involved in outer membrane biogenesis
MAAAVGALRQRGHLQVRSGGALTLLQDEDDGVAAPFRYDSRTAPGRLSGSLLALADLGPAVGVAVPGQADEPIRTARKPGRVLPQRRFDLPSLRAVDADVQVAVDELHFGSDTLAPLRDLRTQALLHCGVLRLQDLGADVAGGRITGATALDGRNDAALWAADLHFRGVDIAGWISGV